MPKEYLSKINPCMVRRLPLVLALFLSPRQAMTLGQELSRCAPRPGSVETTTFQLCSFADIHTYCT